MTNDEQSLESSGAQHAAPPPAGATGAASLRRAPFVIPLMAWVAAGFLFLAVLWTAMFLATRQVDSRTVPLATKGGRP